MINRKSFLMSAALAGAMLAMPALAQEPALEKHIAQMHDALKVTPAQEDQWKPVAQTMRDNEATMHAVVQEKRSHIATQSAVDDLNAYAEIAATHAAATKKLADSFGLFYASLSDAQKKAADEFFREHKRRHAAQNKAAK
jgi:protein CpxP